MVKKTSKEIKRPKGTITDLQTAMGLADNRPLYFSCRVGFPIPQQYHDSQLNLFRLP